MKKKARAFPEQMEQMLVREAAIQVVSSLQETVQMLQVEQQTLLLDLGYDHEGRQSLTRQLATNLLHSGWTGVSQATAHEGVGKGVLEKLLFLLLYDDVDGLPWAILLLEGSQGFRAYVRQHPPVTLSTRRERSGGGRGDDGSSGQRNDSTINNDTPLPEMSSPLRTYYSRTVGSRPGRGARRSAWREPR